MLIYQINSYPCFPLSSFIIHPHQRVYAKKKKSPINKNENESDHNILTSCFIINEINTGQYFPLISSCVFFTLTFEERFGVSICLLHLLFRQYGEMEKLWIWSWIGLDLDFRFCHLLVNVLLGKSRTNKRDLLASWKDSVRPS